LRLVYGSNQENSTEYKVAVAFVRRARKSALMSGGTNTRGK